MTPQTTRYFLGCLIALALSSGISMPALADSMTNPFASGVNLSKYMRSVGLEPTRVHWAQIEPLCAAMLEDGPESYNRCKFEKAELNLLHRADQRECRSVAASNYPKRLSQRQTVETYHVSRGGRPLIRSSRVVPALGKKEISTHRRADVISCMRQLGWASANDWRLGMR